MRDDPDAPLQHRRPRRPELAVDLAANAAKLIQGQSVGRLAAGITRQQASAASANHDNAAFHEHAAHARDLADIDPVPDDNAVYATGAYVAAEIAAGYLATGHADKAAELLLRHNGRWPAAQRCDSAVAATRLLRAFICQGDYHGAAPTPSGRRPRLPGGTVRPSSPRAADVPQDRA